MTAVFLMSVFANHFINGQQRIFWKKRGMKNRYNIPSPSHAVASLGLATEDKDNMIIEMSETTVKFQFMIHD
jgi:hypothetical protein